MPSKILWTQFQIQLLGQIVKNYLAAQSPRMGYHPPQDIQKELHFVLNQIAQCHFIIQIGLGIFVVLFSIHSRMNQFLSPQETSSDMKTLTSWKESRLSFLNDFARLIESLSLFSFISGQTHD